MKRFALSLIAAAAMMLFAYQVPARADSITYVQSTIASGLLGSTPFTNATVTLTLVADTSGVQAFPIPGITGTPLMNAGSATVTITGIGTAAITDSVAVFSSNNMTPADILLFSDGAVSIPTVFIATDYQNDLTHILMTSNQTFFGYGLQTSIGPITGTGFPCCGSPEHNTSMGALSFSNVAVRDTTFSATVSRVPEPSSLTLLGTFLLLLFGFQAHEKKKVQPASKSS